MNKIYNGNSQKIPKVNLKLLSEKIDGKLALKSTIALELLKGTILILIFGTLLLLDHKNPGMSLVILLGMVLILHLGVFLVSPWLIDLIQQWLYRTSWVSLAEFTDFCPEIAEAVQQICSVNKIERLRLGIIDDRNPTVLVYSCFHNNVRLIVSKGLFTHLRKSDARSLATQLYSSVRVINYCQSPNTTV